MSYRDDSGRIAIGDEGYVTPTFDMTHPYILVVDDDQSILRVIMLLLETEGYAGLGFADSRKVLPFLEQVRASQENKPCRLPAVILLDLMMPGISGYEIADWLAKHEWCARIPVVVMSANYRVRGIDGIHGATDWLGKPFQIDALLAKVERYVSPTLLV